MKLKFILAELVGSLIILVVGGFIVAAVWTVSSERAVKRPRVTISGPAIEPWEYGVVPRHVGVDQDHYP